MQIQQLQNQLKVTVANELLFSEGGYTLHAKGEESLAKMAPTLTALTGQQVVVEGFTDNVPIGANAARALPVQLGAVDGTRHRCAALPIGQGCAIEHAVSPGFRRLAPRGHQ